MVRDIGDTTVQLSWSRGFDNHSPIAKYTLQARTPPSGKWKQVRTSKYEAPRGEGGWRWQPWSVPLKPLRIVARECSHAQHVWGEGHTALAKALWHQSSLAFQRVIEGLAYDWTRMRTEPTRSRGPRTCPHHKWTLAANCLGPCRSCEYRG